MDCTRVVLGTRRRRAARPLPLRICLDRFSSREHFIHISHITTIIVLHSVIIRQLPQPLPPCCSKRHLWLPQLPLLLLHWFLIFSHRSQMLMMWKSQSDVVLSESFGGYSIDFTWVRVDGVRTLRT